MKRFYLLLLPTTLLAFTIGSMLHNEQKNAARAKYAQSMDRPAPDFTLSDPNADIVNTAE